MIVPVPNFLADAWDTHESFASAFCSVYESVTLGYDKAVAEGRFRPDGDLVVDESLSVSDLQCALIRGEGNLGASELARRYGVHRSHVWRVAVEMGITLTQGKSPLRQIVEREFFENGITSPSAIIAALTAREVAPPKRNTISQWRTRWEREQ